MQRAGYLVFVIVTRVFWIMVCVALLALLFTRVYPYADGLHRMFLDLFTILLGFSILRLASARPRKATITKDGN